MSRNLQKNQNKPPIPNQSIHLSHQSYSGPLPTSSELQRYEDTVPGIGNRIMVMAEIEQKETILRIKNSQTHEINQKYIGQFFAFMTVLVFAYLIYFALSKNLEWAAATLSIASLAALVSKFLNK